MLKINSKVSFYQGLTVCEICLLINHKNILKFFLYIKFISDIMQSTQFELCRSLFHSRYSQSFQWAHLLNFFVFDGDYALDSIPAEDVVIGDAEDSFPLVAGAFLGLLCCAYSETSLAMFLVLHSNFMSHTFVHGYISFLYKVMLVTLFSNNFILNDME